MDLPKIIQWNHEHNIRLFRCVWVTGGWWASTRRTRLHFLLHSLLLWTIMLLFTMMHIVVRTTTHITIQQHPSSTYRLSSNIIPWMSAVLDLRRLKYFEAIAHHLKLAGDLVCGCVKMYLCVS